MILIPERLFSNPDVHILLRNENKCILHKHLSQSIVDREGYISKDAISIILKGHQSIETYDGAVVEAHASEALILPQGLYHVSDLLTQNGKFESLLFYFDHTIISSFLDQINHDVQQELLQPEIKKISLTHSIKLFTDSIINIYTSSKSSHPEIYNLKMLELLHLIHTEHPTINLPQLLFTYTRPSKKDMRHFMEDNFYKPLKVEDYAQLTGRSLSSFRRDFKQLFKTTPNKWIQNKRIDRAINTLNQQEVNITDLAHSVGYENVSYFIKAFKTRTGLSPKQYTLSQSS